MRDLINIIENASTPNANTIWVRATSWEKLPQYLHSKFPHVKMAGTNWGMCGSGVGGTGAMTRVWPMEFDPNRWPGEESELRNAEAYDVIIDAIQYVTPSEYQSRVGKPHTRLFFKISPYMRDGKVVGGYVEVAQKPRQVSPQAKIPEPEPVHDMDAYHKGIDGLD